MKETTLNFLSNNVQGNRMGWGFVAFGFGMSFGAVITSALGAPDWGPRVFGVWAHILGARLCVGIHHALLKKSM